MNTPPPVRIIGENPPPSGALGSVIIERLAEAGVVTDKLQGPLVGVRAHLRGDGIRIIGAAPTPKGTLTAEALISWRELVEGPENPLLAAIGAVHKHLLDRLVAGQQPAAGHA
jgi:hypothetical protein